MKIGVDQVNDPKAGIRVLRHGMPDPGGRCVVCWMQRAQRGRDNPAVNRAITLGNALRLPVLVVFALTAAYPSAQRRHYRFLLQGLENARDDLRRRGVPFVLRLGEPSTVVPAITHEVQAAIVVADENPVRIGQEWRNTIAARLNVPFLLVDADVVVPSALFPHEEYAARTIRPKLQRTWDEYLQPVPNPKAHFAWAEEVLPPGELIDTDRLLDALKIGGAGEVREYQGGSVEARRRLQRFLTERLPRYATERNQPIPSMTSELSAHLHFGHISPITLALAVRESGAPATCIDAYLEELIVRRELAINFVARNPRYDHLDGCPAWARATLAKHASDPRPTLYSAAQLEAAETHDPLWNAAQKEMLVTGRMHTYLRMYWAKKILEWTPDAESAFAIALNLNDRYEMDGRDPNGYAGVAWAIGGKHDRPWPERPIFGTVRFMSYASTRRKFDSERYIAWVKSLE
ncbi:MAG: deoxyribodipyrimidine photo-lyase [Isosphaeraceae bacterium]|nr:deoxyribodipyrimidine photo-lyase [Isosphaeraceae bacterium]